MESFVVRLYGMKNVDVNEARHEMFSRKFKDEEKTIDMIVSPLFESAIRLHSERANYNTAIWKWVTIRWPDFPNMVLQGLDRGKSMTWVICTFFEDIEMILLYIRYNPDEIDDAHGEIENKGEADL